MASGDGGVEQDVAESRRAVVDRGDAQRGGRRVGHPHRHGVADPQVAAVREHAADGDRVAVDIVERAADHVGIERASRSRRRSAPAAVHGLWSPSPPASG